MFYVVRQLITANDPDHARRFDRTLEYPSGRASYRLLTLVWGVALLGVTALHTLLALTLPTSQYLFISPLLSYGAIILLIFWSLRYGRQMRERIRAEGQSYSALRGQPVRRA